MSRYAIGDVQGCYDELLALLDALAFDTSADTLVFCGDLVNRGPKSLEVLRLVNALGKNAKTVLGNHDLHLLAVAEHTEKKKKFDTLDPIFAADDGEELLAWLLNQPLALQVGDHLICHAGLPPAWTVKDALTYSSEVQAALKADAHGFFAAMYGNEPSRWDPALTGMDRLRYIVNAFTRLRFVHADGRLDFAYKGTLADAPAGLIPWFRFPGRRSENASIVFGHWAALMGRADRDGVHALDTGCVWGQRLTALDLDSGRRISVPARAAYSGGD